MNCSINNLLHFDTRWLKEKTSLHETPAIKALLIGLQVNLDFTTIINGFTQKTSIFRNSEADWVFFVRTLHLML